jgi:hypothetical protein
MRFFLIALSLFIPLSIWAFTPNFSCPREVTVEAEWIYFSPASETSYYAMTAAVTSPFLVESREANRLDDFYSGYRVSAAYNFECDNFAVVTWTDLRAQHNAKISVDAPIAIFPILVPPSLIGSDTIFGDFASDQIHFHYSALEVIFGQKLISFMGINLTGLGGIHYARLNSKENFFYSITDPSIATFLGENRSTFWGIGPELGLTFDKRIGCGFYICATATSAFLIGHPLDKSFTASLNDEGVSIAFSDITNQRPWRVVPYTDIRIGVNYTLNSFFSFCNLHCLSGNLEIGYEVPVYFNGLSNIRTDNNVQLGISFDDYRNVIMHGLFALLALSF